VVPVYTPPNTTDTIYNTFAVAAAMLGIAPGVPVQVTAQKLGVSTSVQLTPYGGTTPYQVGDLTLDPNTAGTQDPISSMVHGSGNPSWYVGDATDVTHVVDLESPPQGSSFQPGLQFHIDAYNPVASVVTLFQHEFTEYVPGLAAPAGDPVYRTCTVGFGCH
jgi:hypothetical protein